MQAKLNEAKLDEKKKKQIGNAQPSDLQKQLRQIHMTIQIIHDNNITHFVVKKPFGISWKKNKHVCYC